MTELVQIDSNPTTQSDEYPSLWKALEDVQDPEFPVSIVDLGLVYGIRREGSRVVVRMTFTSMGCPCTEYMKEDIEKRLLQEPDVDEVEVETVWNPPWTRDRLSARAVEKMSTWGVQG